MPPHNGGLRLAPRAEQTTAEGTPFSGNMNTMALCDFDICRLRRTLTYLLTYLKPNSITLSGRRQVQSWSQTCSELEFGLSSNSLARASTS